MVKHSTVVEAYVILGLEQGSSLEVVKSTYKQLALKTHPDKNPGNEDATAQFQRLSEAYNVLVKHLDRSVSPPRRPPHRYSYRSYDDGYDESDEYDEYDDYDDYDDDYEDLDFYMFLFEELLRGRANRYASARYQRHRPMEPETPEQYQARIARMREEQEQAETRRKREEATRKEAQQRERERERRQAEERQRVKTAQKQAQVAASKKSAEEKVRAQEQQLQYLRSEVFAAARHGDSASVKKGVYENNVDAAGGEIRRSGDEFVETLPNDVRETLLHIAAKHGDVALVEWLDSHGADPEERDAQDFTVFHVALQAGHISILKYFVTTYSPQDSDYKNIYRRPQSSSLLRLALDSREPEAVWIVLDNRLASQEEIVVEWAYVNSAAGRATIVGTSGKKQAGRYEEIRNLFISYGQLPPEPQETGSAPLKAKTANNRAKNGGTSIQVPHFVNEHSPYPSPPPEREYGSQSDDLTSQANSRSKYPSRGQPRSRRPYKHHNQSRQDSPSPNLDCASYDMPPSPGTDTSPQQHSSFPRGRGRGRGGFHGRGRARGGNQPPP